MASSSLPLPIFARPSSQFRTGQPRPIIGLRPRLLSNSKRAPLRPCVVRRDVRRIGGNLGGIEATGGGGGKVCSVVDGNFSAGVGGGGVGGGDGGDGGDGDVLYRIILIKDNVECQSSSHSSNSTHAINPVGANVSSSDGNNNEEHGVISVGLKSASIILGTIAMLRTLGWQQWTTVTNGPINRGDIGISDCENGSDKNEKKMEGKRGSCFAIAAFSLAWLAVLLLPYWIFSCWNTPLSSPTSWPLSSAQTDVVLAVGIILLVSVGMMSGVATFFKEGKLPDNLGFKIFRIVQLLLLFCLSAASVVPLRVCRNSSYWVVWPLASAVFCIIVLPSIVVFEHTEVVIKCIKSAFKKVLQWLRNLSLPECIKAKFKKVLRKQTDPILPQ